jgi:hypothetical protein
MKTVSSIIEDLGGATRVAAITGIQRAGVWKWGADKSQGGNGGVIPQRHHRAILDYARANSIELTADDFIPPAAPRRKTKRVRA